MLAVLVLAARFVVLPDAARLHAKPDVTSPAAWELGDGFSTWLLVGERDGGWLEVENIPGDIDLVGLPGGAPPEHPVCYSAPHGIASWRLRLFAKASDAATVLTRDVERKAPDGTSVTFRKGLVVEPGKGIARVRPGGLSLRLSIPKDALATAYEGDPQVFHSSGASLTSFPPEMTDSGYRALGQTLAVDRGDVWEPVDLSPAPPRSGWVDETLFTPCASIHSRHRVARTRGDDEQVAIGGGVPGAIGGGLTGDEPISGSMDFLAPADPKRTPRPKLAVGTELRWPDGSQAGAVVETGTMPALDAHGCFAIGFAYEGGGPGGLTLCPKP